MLPRIHAVGGILLLAGAVVFLAPDPCRGGPHGGGGYHGGGYHGGGYHGGYRGHPYYGYRGYSPFYGYPFYTGIGLTISSYPVLDPGYYPGGPVAYDPAYAPAYPAGVGGHPVSPPPGAPTAPGLLPPPDELLPAPANKTALVTVTVPADAEVWFDGRKMSVSGLTRRFHTPPLSPDNRYAYDVSAHWDDNGRSVTQSQKIVVTAGASVNVAFPTQP